MSSITVILLTLNEEKNIAIALTSVLSWAKDVFVLDSGSSDATRNIAASLGAKVFHRSFDNYANQRNYAINELPVMTDWVLFLDADEFLSDALKTEINETVSRGECDGYYIKYRMIFMGRWIKHGGYYPSWILRLFRKGCATVDRDINEHTVIIGKVGYLRHDFIHEDKKGIGAWIEKHNRYAAYEAQELLKARDNKGQKDDFARLTGSQAQRKRWIRQHIWNPLLPPLIRPFIYYIYRYVFRLGFLDGKEGFIFHFLQGLWFPFLIDVKYLELKRQQSGKQ